MTGNAALLFDFEQDHIVIAVDPYLAHLLHMAGAFALVPQFVARAGPVDGLPQLDGFRQCLAVHPGEHQDALALGILGDDRHKAIVRLDISDFLNLLNKDWGLQKTISTFNPRRSLAYVSGFTADGTFVDGVLHHGGMVLRRVPADAVGVSPRDAG